MGIGDWGLGIGDWGLGPIPNPQSPLGINMLKNIYKIYLYIKFIFLYKNMHINNELF